MAKAAKARPYKNFLRPREIEQCKQDLASAKEQIERAKFFDGAKVDQCLDVINAVEERMQQAPPDHLAPEQKDKLKAFIADAEEKIRDGMLSHEEMRRNPPGAAQQHARWLKRNKQRIFDWKNAQLALNPGISQMDADELLNVAKLRPRPSQLNMEGAQIEAKTVYSFPSEKFKQAYDQIDWRTEDEKLADEGTMYAPDIVERVDSGEIDDIPDEEE